MEGTNPITEAPGLVLKFYALSVPTKPFTLFLEELDHVGQPNAVCQHNLNDVLTVICI
jgi:hypothetical protein